MILKFQGYCSYYEQEGKENFFEGIDISFWEQNLDSLQ